MTTDKKIRERFWLWVVIGAMMPLVIAVVFGIMSEKTSEIERFRAEGRVGYGIVTDVREVEESYTSRRGRMRTRTNRFIDFRYDLYPATSYADYVRGGEVLQPGSEARAMTSHSRSSTGAEAEAHRPGQPVAVVVLPDDPFNPDLYSAVRDYSNWPNYLIMLGALLASIFCGWRALVAWRILRSHRALPMANAR